jgi:hypothetical protein
MTQGKSTPATASKPGFLVLDLPGSTVRDELHGSSGDSRAPRSSAPGAGPSSLGTQMRA